MSKLVLLCLETNKKSDTDYIYINATIKRFYRDDRKIVYRPVYMGSKTKYNTKDTVKQIKDYFKNFGGEKVVIYFIDADDKDTSYETNHMYEEIKKYCEDNDYLFVSFCKDVEDVYWGDTVKDSEKVKKAGEFQRKKLINNIEEKNLQDNTEKRHCSNILNVLDMHFKRK